ncbi:carboxymuconolactone decarboxylase family protein [Aquabacterium sp. OR-4]|uniref:carboxymuconolactone decarboxylase family protein n=1 Tax=Aquabacterium sp. OR-4 TaxID=2978127 RepID=UPI0021B200C5|nr:carboxymuconolactone decarboxylase family protein [Aquabacterium sp. OR-4]MDT7835165.1 carboxymuconolactone decarboxylase family protein [Aquabacterium sp. OR-4]
MPHLPADLTQGFGPQATERLPLPEPAAWSDEQRRIAQALIDGPRAGVFGPFVPLLHAPALAEPVGALGEVLRFRGSLPDRVRELLICAVARHTHNQFEWQLHAALARRAGVAAAVIDALRDGARPDAARDGLAADEAAALDLAHELMRQHGASDATYARAVAQFGSAGTVELATLVGYFTLACWVMNLARTPARPSDEPALPGLPG